MNHPSEKILPISRLADRLAVARAENKTVVLCHGVFDLLHPGHIRHLSEAKKLGDLLVVTVTQDKHVNKGPGRPAFTEGLRAESLAALAHVDYVAINEAPTAVPAILALRPNFYVKGQDYENRSGDITQEIHNEERAIKEVGGVIHFTHDITFSSTNILNSHFSVYPDRARDFLTGFKQKYSADEVIDRLKSLKDLKIAVVGDTIIDEYHYCQPMGKSPKETIVTTRYLNEEAFPGGILACANHLAAFSDNVHLITCLGAKDSKKDLISTQLNSKITTQFFYREDSGTVVKRRYVEPAFLTKMFQITFITDTDLDQDLSHSIARYMKETLGDYDLVLVADYGHGFLNKELRHALQSYSPFLALNVQTNSANIGYNLVTKYEKADYICIDEPELRLAMQSKYSPIQELITEFCRRQRDSKVTITRGHHGSITAFPNPGSERQLFDAPCLSNRVVDRVGAGDAYFAVTSMLAARNEPAELLGLVGNAAGAMAVEVVCNRSSMQAIPLYKFMKALLS